MNIFYALPLGVINYDDRHEYYIYLLECKERNESSGQANDAQNAAEIRDE